MDTLLYTGFTFKPVVGHSNPQTPSNRQHYDKKKLYLDIKNYLSALKWLLSILKLKSLFNLEKTRLKHAFITRYFL